MTTIATAPLEQDTSHHESAEHPRLRMLTRTDTPPAEDTVDTDTPHRGLRLVPPAAPTSRGVPRAAEHTAHSVARGIIEAIEGLRPVAHLAQGCDLATYEKLRRRVRWESQARAEQAEQAPVPPITEDRRVLSVMSTHTQEVPGGVEASTTFRLGDHVRALGFRLEPVRGRWRIVALEIG